MRTRSRRKHPRKAPFPQFLDAFRQLDFAQVRAGPRTPPRPPRLTPSGMLTVCSTPLNANARSPMASASSGTSTCAFLPEKTRQRQLELFAHFAHGASSFRNGRPTTGAAQNGRFCEWRPSSSSFDSMRQPMAAIHAQTLTSSPLFARKNEKNMRVLPALLPALRTPAAPGARTPRPCARGKSHGSKISSSVSFERFASGSASRFSRYVGPSTAFWMSSHTFMALRCTIT